jgi:hypothetical protein
VERQDIFAFLPVRSYGFNFIIQSDFLVSSSREDIIVDKEWNKLIRDQIASVFMHCLNLFKIDPALKISWYKYVPRHSIIQDKFFTNVVDGIMNGLK